ncbi:MAG: hypothetical protein PHW76_03655 [Alphaproteobacteria bacterium]|nr:hypothetical protein [Alphaproteobacteria bacterium]
MKKTFLGTIAIGAMLLGLSSVAHAQGALEGGSPAMCCLLSGGSAGSAMGGGMPTGGSTPSLGGTTGNLEPLSPSSIPSAGSAAMTGGGATTPSMGASGNMGAPGMGTGGMGTSGMGNMGMGGGSGASGGGMMGGPKTVTFNGQITFIPQEGMSGRAGRVLANPLGKVGVSLPRAARIR